MLSLLLALAGQAGTIGWLPAMSFSILRLCLFPLLPHYGENFKDQEGLFFPTFLVATILHDTSFNQDTGKERSWGFRECHYFSAKGQALLTGTSSTLFCP